MTFSILGLDERLNRAVEESGYEQTTAIQAKAIPVVLEGRDILAGAQTGTGKTAAFALPILQMLLKRGAPARKPRVLILAPTRELAAQLGESFERYGKHLSYRSLTVFGGVNINPQIAGLRRGVDILIATPGRLLDLVSQKAADLAAVEIFVLDEADRMLDMGFIPDINRILRLLPRARQNLMFSATYSSEIRTLASRFLVNPIDIDVAPRNAAAETIDQVYYRTTREAKTAVLCHLIRQDSWGQVLVFVRTKHGANRLTKQLERQRIPSVAIHGNKSQGARTKALADFKKGGVQVLVATDIAARGLDIERLPHVVNYDIPHVPEDYVHRIGRTGRAGETGCAVSLVSPDEVKLFQAIQRLVKVPVKEKSAGSVQPLDEPGATSDQAPRASASHVRSADAPRAATGPARRAPADRATRAPQGRDESRRRPDRARRDPANQPPARPERTSRPEKYQDSPRSGPDREKIRTLVREAAGLPRTQGLNVE